MADNRASRDTESRNQFQRPHRGERLRFYPCLTQDRVGLIDTFVSQ